MRPERPARCRYSVALGGTSVLYTWLQSQGRAGRGSAGSGWQLGGQRKRKGSSSWQHSGTGQPSQAGPDGGQVEAARGRGRGQQQRRLVVAERVQRLDGLRALLQQHCSRRSNRGGGAGAGRGRGERLARKGGRERSRRSRHSTAQQCAAGAAQACLRSCGRPTARCAAGRPAGARAPRCPQTPSRAPEPRPRSAPAGRRAAGASWRPPWRTHRRPGCSGAAGRWGCACGRPRGLSPGPAPSRAPPHALSAAPPW